MGFASLLTFFLYILVADMLFPPAKIPRNHGWVGTGREGTNPVRAFIGRHFSHKGGE